jgi:hypothetical protein
MKPGLMTLIRFFLFFLKNQVLCSVSVSKLMRKLLILRTVLGWGISPSLGHYLYKTTQTEKRRRHTSMPGALLKPMILVLERAKTFRALEHTVTVMDLTKFLSEN